MGNCATQGSMEHQIRVARTLVSGRGRTHQVESLLITALDVSGVDTKKLTGLEWL